MMMDRNLNAHLPDPIRIISIVFGIIGGIMLCVAVTLLLLLRGELRFIALPFGITGVVFSVIALCFSLHTLKKRRLRDELLSSGECITAQIIGLEPNMMVTINGRHPKRLACKYEEDGVSYICHSDNLPGYPELTGSTVAVYRDRYDKRRYYVDASSAIKPSIEL